MSQSICVGLDFSSLQYRAAYVFEGRVIPVPAQEYDATWSGHIITLPTEAGITFSTLKQQIGTGQMVFFKGRREPAEDLILNSFQDIKRNIEEYAGEDIGQVAIAVPGRYAEYRRAEVVRIAESAGLGNISLINDATAAVVGYTSERKESSTLLIYSMGFIGYEISLQRATKQTMREIAHHGDDSPSGLDFDLTIINDCIEFLEHKGTPLPTRTYTDHWFRLRTIVAEAKHQLTVDEIVTFVLPPYITGAEQDKPIDFSRSDFEQLIAHQVQTSMEPVDRVLEEAHMRYADIDKVLLVGGSTRISYIQRQLERRFGSKLIQPRDDMLARGAAIHAYKTLSNQQRKGSIQTPTESVKQTQRKEVPIPITTTQTVESGKQEEPLMDTFEPVTVYQKRQDDAQGQPKDREVITHAEVESLFNHVHSLIDTGAYHEADELLTLMLTKVEDARKDLDKMRFDQ